MGRLIGYTNHLFAGVSPRGMIASYSKNNGQIVIPSTFFAVAVSLDVVFLSHMP
jgi:hypothetical protein